MTQQIADSNGLPRSRGIGEVFRNRVIETDLPRFDQHHDGRGGKLLAHGTGLEHRLGFDRHLQLDVRETKALGADDFPISRHQQRDAWYVLSCHLRLHILCDRVRRRV